MEPITRKEKFMAKAGGQNVKTPEPITREEKFLAQIRGGGVTSWNDLTDKPFYEETTPGINIEWDGNVDGLNILMEGAYNYKVSDDVFPASALDNGWEVVCKDYSDSTTVVYKPEDIDGEIVTGGVTDNGFMWMLSRQGHSGDAPDIFAAMVMEDVEMEGMKLSKGLYLLGGEDNGFYVQSLYIPGETVIHKLDEKYLPELTSPSGKKFKLSVDDNGTISATAV